MKKPFHTLTAAEKRVAIAKDAIKQIGLKRFRIKRGTYLVWSQKRDRINALDFSQESLKRKESACQVCQIGASLASAIRLFNNASTDACDTNVARMFRIASAWFDHKTLVLMEGAFETECGWLSKNCYAYVSDEEVSAVASFRAKYRSDRARSLAIFRNIIANKGEFIP